ncbi:hypothetical protein F2Q70_00023104 [Brassica cretica]|uniref:Uncharacterized protein n=1 Tax=Brassica cretica TaxID=69181 RepID=A0A8S9GLY7_BRACR|nr:hypothetical protein F2Q70_00023104 [Brassica cretica]
MKAVRVDSRLENRSSIFVSFDWLFTSVVATNLLNLSSRLSNRRRNSSTLLSNAPIRCIDSSRVADLVIVVSFA